MFRFFGQRLGCFLHVSHGSLFGGFHYIGCRLGSLAHLPGVDHSGLFRVFHEWPGSGLWMKWGSSLNTTPLDDVVSSKFQTLLLCIMSALSCLQHGRSAGCAAPLAAFNLCPPCGSPAATAFKLLPWSLTFPQKVSLTTTNTLGHVSTVVLRVAKALVTLALQRAF